MNADTLTIRSSINSRLYKKLLFRGSFFSLLGFLPLLYGSLWMNAQTLSFWGIPLFFSGIALIMFGMLPYKRVAELQKHPNQIHLIDEHSLCYDHFGKQTMTIPLSAVDNLEYFEGGDLYGIKLDLKKSPKDKAIVHDPRFSMERFQKNSRKNHDCDLFFPYFSKRSFDKLNFKPVAAASQSQIKPPLAQDRAS